MNLREQLKEMEGLRLKPYLDTEGHWTIGRGTNLDEGITEDEADYLFTNRLRKATQEVDGALPWARSLNPPRFAVLVNMAYQMGLGGLMGFRRMLAACEIGDYKMAEAEMLDSKWAREDTPNRARVLATQMRTGAWPT